MTEPLEPPQPPPAASPVPPVSWSPPPPPPAPMPGAGAGALFDDRPASSLTLGDAFSTGFGLIAKPAFIGPLLVLAVVVHLVISTVVGPLVPQFTPGSTPSFTPEQASKFLSGIAGSVILSIIAGIIINVYGQVWTVAASSGPYPSVGAAMGLVARRWIGVLGAGLVVGVITIGLLIGLVIVVGIVFAALGSLGWLLVVAAAVLYIWIVCRLAMAGWLAAEGHGVMASVNGSWAITRGSVLRIIGWSLAYGIVFGLIGAVLGFILGLVPYVGAGIAQAVGIGLGFGAGVTLFRRTQAAGAPAAPAPAVPAPAAAS